MTLNLPLGSSLCGLKLVMLKKEGHISSSDFSKMCTIYHRYTERSNFLWESNLDQTNKRFFDNLLLMHTLKTISEMKIEHEMVTRLKNVITSHHKAKTKLHQTWKRIKRDSNGTKSK